MITAMLTTVIVWTVLLGVYYLLFANKTFFQWNRIYLLSSITFGLLLPWISIPILNTELAPSFGGALQSGWQEAQFQMEEIIIIAQTSESLNWWKILMWVVFCGMLVRFFRLTFGLWKISQLAKNGSIEKKNSFWLVHSNQSHLPFSFFNAIFWGNKANIGEVDQELILRHEQVHLKQGHSWDVLALEVLLIPFWWLPPLYLYKKEIRELHEYLADAASLQHISPMSYKKLLVKYIAPGTTPSLAHAFTNFQLKKRLIMMSKQPSSTSKKFMYLAVLPIVLLFMSFKPNVAIPTSDYLINTSQVGDPIDEATVASALSPSIERLKKDPKDSNAAAMLTKQLYTLQQKYPGQESELLNISRNLIKEGDSDYYVALIDGRIQVKHSAQRSDVYKEVDKMPHLPGCEDLSGAAQKDCHNMNLVKNIYTNIKYPEEARKGDHQGMVLIRFIVNTYGNVESPEILRSVPGGCDAEVVRVVNTMKFVPGVKDGKNVNVVFNLPVKFKLEGDGSKNKAKDKDKVKIKVKDKEKQLEKMND